MLDLSPVLTEGVNMTILSVALGLGNSFAFGLVQLYLKNLIPEQKPMAFIVASTFATVALYYALVSDLLVVKVVIAAVSAAAGVTGGINFYKKDVKS